MQVDEGRGFDENTIDLTLSKRIFQRLHPEVFSIHSVIPTLSDFDREYRYIIEEQKKLIALTLENLANP